jgi:1-acyl-sn-glycerol-3-phosphate acyltransferase
MKLLSLVKFIGRPILLILFSVEYHGLENIPATGPVILAGNHPSYLDPVLLVMPVTREIKFMAWDALFNVPFLGWLIKSLGAFPVDTRRGKGEAAYLEARRVLQNGWALGIFPEGQRSERGPMGELRTGVARLAIETGAPIVPVTIGGASRAWPKHKLLPKPAKVIVRFHRPIRVSADQRDRDRDNKQLHHQLTQEVAKSINRSLTPALRGTEAWERWYRQPPSHIRIYEWVPLVAALISTVVTLLRSTPGPRWMAIWTIPIAYYLYLNADLMLIKPTRLAKWVRNSMPLWLIMVWHYSLTEALSVPQGDLNHLLALCLSGAFFPFFWEDYYTLQKFVRGLVVVYYVSLALMLNWPEPMGPFFALLGFVILFSVWYRVVGYRVTVPILVTVTAIGVYATRPGMTVLIFILLAAVALVYIQTFITAAYDIRKAATIDQRE